MNTELDKLQNNKCEIPSFVHTSMNTEMDKLQNNEREIPKCYSEMETLSQATKHKMSEEASK